MTEEAPLPAPGSAPEAEKRDPLTSAQWLEIRTMAELGTARLREIARTYGVSHQAVSRHLKDHGIVMGSKAPSVAAAVTEKTAEKVAAVIAPFAERRQTRLEETREFYYTSHSNLDKIIMSKIATAVRDGKALAELSGDMKMLNFAKRALLIGRNERFTVLDAENQIDVASLPDLIIRDLTSDEITAIQTGEDPLEDLEDLIAAEEEAVASV